MKLKLKGKEIDLGDEVVLKISDLNENPDNPNSMTPSEYKGLLKSINVFGFRQPILVRKKDMLVADGNHRMKAMKELGYENIRAFVGEWSDAELRLLIQAFNKPRGKHDPEKDAAQFMLIQEDGNLEILADVVGKEQKALQDIISKNEKDNSEIVQGSKDVVFKTNIFVCPNCKHKGKKKDFVKREG